MLLKVNFYMRNIVLKKVEKKIVAAFVFDKIFILRIQVLTYV